MAAGCTATAARSTLTDCTISGNTATDRRRAVQLSARRHLTACTISGNIATGSGGGVYVTVAYRHGTVTLTDTIVAGNTDDRRLRQRHRRTTGPAASPARTT